jgi:hypothetical protein
MMRLRNFKVRNFCVRHPGCAVIFRVILCSIAVYFTVLSLLGLCLGFMEARACLLLPSILGKLEIPNPIT